MLISIIIPVYKVEPYIERCIQSVLRQTYRHLEVILVDDCSPDRSMELAKGCIEQSPLSKDLSFIYLRHDHNRGLSAARNTGIDAATGDYVYFLDSDDAIIPNCINILIKKTYNGKTEVVCGGLELFGQVDKTELNNNFVFYNASYLSSHKVISAFVRGRLPIVGTNKLINRLFLTVNKIYFKEGLLYEDNLWSFMVFHLAARVETISTKTYCYYLRQNSIMTSTEQEKRISNLLRIYSEYDIFLNRRKRICRKSQIFVINKKAAMITFLIYNNQLATSRKLKYIKTILLMEQPILVIANSLFQITRLMFHNLKIMLYQNR